MTFDPTKPVQTRDGRKARIICTDARGPHPIVALVDAGEWEEITLHHASGNTAWGAPKEQSDLVNIPTKRKGWVNVYQSTGRAYMMGRTSPIYADRRHADETARSDRIACVEIEWEEPA